MVGYHERRMATPLYNTHKSKDYKKKEEKKKKCCLRLIFSAGTF